MRVHTLRLASFVWVVSSACSSIEPNRAGGAFGDDDSAASSSGSASDAATSSSGGGGSSTSSNGSSSGSRDAGPSDGDLPGGTLNPGDVVWTLEVGQRSRTVRVHVPASITEQKLPVVIALHGNGDDASNFEATSGLKARADRSGFVLLTPNGIARDVAVGSATAPNVPWDAYNLYPDNWDLQLMTALRERVQSTGSVASERVSVYGFSQGGYMAYRVAEALSSDFACAAVLSAADPSGYAVSFTRQIPIALMIGTNDYGIAQARATDLALTQAGHEHEYKEIDGLGHAMAPAPKRFEPLDYCLGKPL